MDWLVSGYGGNILSLVLDTARYQHTHLIPVSKIKLKMPLNIEPHIKYPCLKVKAK